MKENPVLEALSILHTWAENKTADMDNALYLADDGEQHTVKEAQELIERKVSHLITDLEVLRTQCRNNSWKDFKARHL